MCLCSVGFHICLGFIWFGGYFDSCLFGKSVPFCFCIRSSTDCLTSIDILDLLFLDWIPLAFSRLLLWSFGVYNYLQALSLFLTTFTVVIWFCQIEFEGQKMQKLGDFKLPQFFNYPPYFTYISLSSVQVSFFSPSEDNLKSVSLSTVCSLWGTLVRSKYSSGKSLSWTSANPKRSSWSALKKTSLSSPTLLLIVCSLYCPFFSTILPYRLQ